MTEHDLKCWPEHYDATERGEKTLELRIDDRNYQTGDVLFLRRYEPMADAYTGASMRVRVTHTVRGGPWLCPGYVAMSVRPLTPEEHDPSFVCGGCGRDTHIRVSGLCLDCVRKETQP